MEGLLIPPQALPARWVSGGGEGREVSAITQWLSNLPVTTAGARERAGFMEQPV